MGFVYIITHKNSLNMRKIGITKQWDKRKKSLKIDKATHCNLLIEFPENIEKYIEKRLHSEFSDHRLPQSEWFNLNSINFNLLTHCARSVAQEYNGKVVYDFLTLSEKEQDAEKYAMEGLCDWFENDIYDNFYENKYRSNPFLCDFEIYREGEESVSAALTFIEPNNAICRLNILGYYCQKKKDTIIYLAEPGFWVTDGRENGNWYTDNYGHEEIILDEYLDILLERLNILTHIDQKSWPSKVWADIVKSNQKLEEYGVLIDE